MPLALTQKLVRQDIPASVFELGDAIKTLDATNNRIAALPPALSALRNLQRLVRLLAKLQGHTASQCSDSAARRTPACGC